MKTRSAPWPTEASVREVRAAEAIAVLAVVAVAVALAWAAGVGPFGNDAGGPSLESVESLVVAREGGGSAVCFWMDQGEAYGKLQDVYRCRVKGSKASGYVSACYWIRQVKVIKITKPRAEYAC